MGQRTTNKPNSHLIEIQIITKIDCSWSPQKSGDHEQGCFALYCVSVDYKKLMFAVRCLQKSAGTLILCGSTLSKGAKHIGVLNEAKNLVWQADIMNRGGASDPSLTLRMTKGTVRRTKGTVGRTKGRSGGQRDGQEDKGTVERTKGREELSFDIVFCAIGFIFRICQPALQIAEYFPFIPIVALPQHRLQFISCFTEPDMVLPV